MSHLSRPAASQLQSFIANMPIFQISKVSREVWIVLKGNMEKQTNNIDWVKQDLRRGDCGLWTSGLPFWALGVYGDHSKWSERENF